MLVFLRSNDGDREAKGLQAQQEVLGRKEFKAFKANKAFRVCKAYKEPR